MPIYAEDDCQTLKTRHILNGKTIEESETVCLFKRKQNLNASSKNCYPILNSQCQFRTIKKEKDFSSYVTEIGSPGFNLCHALNGSPQLFEIEIKGEWKPFSRCFWQESKEFVDIDELVAYYKTL